MSQNPFMKQPSMPSPVPTDRKNREFAKSLATEFEGTGGSLRERVKELEEKLKEQEEKAKKDQEFYEEALQKRFDQMEAFEEKADGLELKCSQVESKLEKAEMRADRSEHEVTKLQAKIKDLEQDLAEKTTDIDRLTRAEGNPEAIKQQKEIVNQKIQENYSLKQIIDQQRAEMDKMRKKLVAQEDKFTNKNIELDQLNEELKNMRSQLQVKNRQDQ